MIYTIDANSALEYVVLNKILKVSINNIHNNIVFIVPDKKTNMNVCKITLINNITKLYNIGLFPSFLSFKISKPKQKTDIVCMALLINPLIRSNTFLQLPS